MPEGDTIHRIAHTLGTALRGQRLVSVSSEKDIELAAMRSHCVDRVEPRGKHLLIHADNGYALHTHMGMTGSWHIYAPAQAWRKPRHQAAAILETETQCAVCFSPKLIEVLSVHALRRHPLLKRLGPDMLAGKFDVDAAMARLRARPDVAIGEALLDQTIVAGIGNVYKSETLFLAGIHPLRRVRELDDDALRELLDANRALMKRNLRGYPRKTRFRTDGRRVWVYNRQGQHCFRCDAIVARTRQGDLGRSTYFCPVCQASPRLDTA